MSYTLGLDIGSNSIGWALTSDEKILDLGVRIFPVGVKEDSYNKSGTEESKNSTRRSARGIRRLYDRYKIRRRQLKKLLLSLDMLPPETMQFTSFRLYELRKKALDEKISLQEFGRIILLLNQRRGFKSNKKGESKSASETAKELEGIKLQMAELDSAIKDSNCRTIGEYFYSLFLKQVEHENWRNPDEPIERIRKRFVFRKTYEYEFDELWKAQKQYYPGILTDENYIKIKENCLYYQRPLKSQKHLVSKCRFEPKKRVAPKSSFEFQEFRIWQFINNLRITGPGRNLDLLTKDERNILFAEFNRNEDLSPAKMIKAIGLNKQYSFQNGIAPKIKGNTTNSRLSKVLDEESYFALSAEEKFKLWHVLYFAQDEDWLIDYAVNKLHFSHETAVKYAKTNLEADYGSISTKAIRKIIPFMQDGYDYAEACELAGYHHSFDEDKDGKERELLDKIIREKDDDRRNPLVEQAISETVRLVNEIIAENGKPSKIRVEFARQLKMPKDKREKLKSRNDEKEKSRDSYRDFLVKSAGLSNPSRADIIKFELWLEMEFDLRDFDKKKGSIDISEFRKFTKNVKAGDASKYKLWLECGRISPYTGKVIGLSELFSPEIEVEHIIPYSRSLDDSFSNKTLCERLVNADKGNRTPFEYLSGHPQKWEAFLDRVKSFPFGKQLKFQMKEIPSDFISQQLNNTAYIAKHARKKLKLVCRDVQVTNGQATSHLRRMWGLNKVLNPTGANDKSRHDHRHHAIDALVIASTTPDFINTLSRYASFDALGKLRISNFPMPFPEFFSQTEELFSTILISYRNKQRLISSKLNKYKHSKNTAAQTTVSIRGPLHEETFFGRILNPETNKQSYVIRKPLSSFKDAKQLQKIVDPAIRKLVLEHVEKCGSVASAMSTPLFMISKDGKKKIPVNKVRVIDSAEELVQLRPKENPKLFVAPGDNYCIAIYEKDGKRAYNTISFYNAVHKKINKQPLFPLTEGDKPFLMSLSKKDLVVVYNQHPDEINWNDKSSLFKNLYLVRKFDKNGRIALAKHNLSNIDVNNPSAYPLGSALLKGFSTLKAVKVHISLTGKIVKA